MLKVLMTTLHPSKLDKGAASFQRSDNNAVSRKISRASDQLPWKIALSQEDFK